MRASVRVPANQGWLWFVFPSGLHQQQKLSPAHSGCCYERGCTIAQDWERGDKRRAALLDLILASTWSCFSGCREHPRLKWAEGSVHAKQMRLRSHAVKAQSSIISFVFVINPQGNEITNICCHSGPKPCLVFAFLWGFAGWGIWWTRPRAGRQETRLRFPADLLLWANPLFSHWIATL